MDGGYIPDPTDFQQRIALAWASACLALLDSKKPDASAEERVKTFTDAIEGGLSIAAKVTER